MVFISLPIRLTSRRHPYYYIRMHCLLLTLRFFGSYIPLALFFTLRRSFSLFVTRTNRPRHEHDIFYPICLFLSLFALIFPFSLYICTNTRIPPPPPLPLRQPHRHLLLPHLLLLLLFPPTMITMPPSTLAGRDTNHLPNHKHRHRHRQEHSLQPREMLHHI